MVLTAPEPCAPHDSSHAPSSTARIPYRHYDWSPNARRPYSTRLSTGTTASSPSNGERPRSRAIRTHAIAHATPPRTSQRMIHHGIHNKTPTLSATAAPRSRTKQTGEDLPRAHTTWRFTTGIHAAHQVARRAFRPITMRQAANHRYIPIETTSPQPVEYAIHTP